jgi:hypothetical protein
MIRLRTRFLSPLKLRRDETARQVNSGPGKLMVESSSFVEITPKIFAGRRA